MNLIKLTFFYFFTFECNVMSAKKERTNISLNAVIEIPENTSQKETALRIKELNSINQDLENLVTDPHYFLQEYCHKVQNEIDIAAETAINKDDGSKVNEINKERASHLKIIERFQENCKESLKKEYNASYTNDLKNEIKQVHEKCKMWTDEFYSNNNNNLKTREEIETVIEDQNTNIEDFKQMILDYNMCFFDKESKVKHTKLKSKYYLLGQINIKVKSKSRINDFFQNFTYLFNL